MNKKLTLSLLCTLFQLFCAQFLFSQNTVKLTIDVTVPDGVDISKVEATMPDLKYNKKFIYSYTFDDTPLVAFSRSFNRINKKWMDDGFRYHFNSPKTTGYVPEKTLGYTDGCGNEKRFAPGYAIWPNVGNKWTNMYMEDYPTDSIYFKWTDIPPMLDFGGSVYYHNVNGRVWGTYNPDLKKYVISDLDSLRMGFDEDQAKTILKLGRGLKVLICPDGDTNYIKAAKQYPDIVMIGDEKGGTANSNFPKVTHYPKDKSFDLTVKRQYRRYFKFEVYNTPDAYGRVVDTHNSDNGMWMHDFSHGVQNAIGEEEYVLTHFTRINDDYGKDGDDSVWFATLDEVYEYWFMKKGYKLTKKVSGRKITFDIEVPVGKYFYFTDFSLLLSGITTTQGVTVSPSANIYGLAYAVNGNSLLVNVDFNQSLKDRAEKYTKMYESSKKQEDLDDAVYFVSRLKKELKDPYLVRLGLRSSSDPAINSANVKSNKYNGFFLYGSNMAWLNNGWSDQDISDLLVGSLEKNWDGLGVNSLRPALYEDFIEKYGIDIRKSAFQYYANNGSKVNTAFIGDDPAPKHVSKETYAVTSAGVPYPSESYRNLYDPIWVEGENGRVVNDSNFYAKYVYDLVKGYGSHVKFWEIKNEPDYVEKHATSFANGLPGSPRNWWDNDPDPALLHNFHAPIQHYIRMLRISYEVIKSVDPEAFICTGGIGYASFLDAILRNTDNPDGGKVTDEYPLKGGAWFDCLSFHYYPVYSLRKFVGYDKPGNENGWDYFRHSDAAVDCFLEHKNKLDTLLAQYGYGITYPEKEVIVTETNIPNRAVQVFIGSQQAQRNYLVKTAILSQKNKISAVYPYCPYDSRESDDPSANEYHYSGFYKPIPETPGGATLRINESGIAWRNLNRQLKERRYDATETAKLNLPTQIEGGAFYSSTSKDYVYVLWAKTSKDKDEESSATYSFAAAKNVAKMVSVAWNEEETAIAGNTVNLTGNPIFIKLNADVTPKVSVTGVTLNKTSAAMGKNKTLQLLATVAPDNAATRSVLWSSSNPNVARVDNLGKVTSVVPGNSIIKVTTVDGNKEAACNLTVTQDTISLSYIQFASHTSLDLGDTLQLFVTYFPDNATNKKINWISENPDIVSVNENGVAKAHSIGKVKIIASPVEGNGSKAKSGQITVNAVKTVESISLNQTSKELTVGETFQLSATINPVDAKNKEINWNSSNPAVVGVDATGKITALAVGTATITVKTANNNKTSTCSVTVKQEVLPIVVTDVTLDRSSSELKVGETLQLQATITPTDAENKSLTWSSSNSSVASVDATGKITALTAGTVIITVKTANNKTNTCSITVTQEVLPIAVTGVTLDRSSSELKVGETLQLRATVTPENADNKALIWSSSQPSIARVDESGTITAYTTGLSIITVETVDEGKTALHNVLVKESYVTGIDKVNTFNWVVAPNPSSGNFSIQFKLNQQEDLQIDLYSSTGALMHRLLPRQKLDAGDHSFTFNPGLNPGTYIISLKSEKMNKQQKLIIF